MFENDFQFIPLRTGSVQNVFIQTFQTQSAAINRVVFLLFKIKYVITHNYIMLKT